MMFKVIPFNSNLYYCYFRDTMYIDQKNNKKQQHNKGFSDL